MATFNIKQAIEAQKEYCTLKQFPRFAPVDGYCYRCGKNIYQEHINKYGSSGISVEVAGKHHITGCPHCNASYCD